MLQNIFNQKNFMTDIIDAGLMTENEYYDVMENKDEKMSEERAVTNYFADNAEKYKALADLLGVEQAHLLEISKVPQTVIDEIPRKVASELRVFPFGYTDDSGETVKIATAQPSSYEIKDTLRLRINKDFKLYIAIDSEIDRCISKYYGDAEALEAANSFAAEFENTAVQETETVDEKAPVVTIVNSIIEQAARMNASDIHIEPMENKLRIRYRVDGALVDRPSYMPQMHQPIIARLKIMAKIDIAEKRKPQDGRITFNVGGVEYDIRVSMLPTVYGEKCVMRLAIRENLQKDKKDLGLTAYDIKIFDSIFSNPNGIILVTGPTGSGKSTTLYTALSELNTEDVNIVTVEDPVEANVAGVNQVQVDKVNLSFASALRSILRQDPDIIMIGEIRDGETAKIAVESAITGHLVVSTLHTNSASASISRLVNMGVEPYLAADAMVGILAQRLVRKLCPKCKHEHIMTEDERNEMRLNERAKGMKIYDKVGCGYCNGTGYLGRTAIYEILEVNNKIRTLISRNATSEEIKKAAMENGMHTLRQSAIQLVLKGVTTMDEMRKVSHEF